MTRRGGRMAGRRGARAGNRRARAPRRAPGARAARDPRAEGDPNARADISPPEVARWPAREGTVTMPMAPVRAGAAPSVIGRHAEPRGARTERRRARERRCRPGWVPFKKTRVHRTVGAVNGFTGERETTSEPFQSSSFGRTSFNTRTKTLSPSSRASLLVARSSFGLLSLRSRFFFSRVSQSAVPPGLSVFVRRDVPL